MSKEKLNPHRNKYCLLLVGFLIFSGCASETKKDEILGIQRNRIVKLERDLSRKNKIINELKAERWVKKPVKVSEATAFKPLREKIKIKDWVGALRVSSTLKQKHPNSLTLARYRYSIFKKMGLMNQANQELDWLKKLKAQASRKSIKK